MPLKQFCRGGHPVAVPSGERSTTGESPSNVVLKTHNIVARGENLEFADTGDSSAGGYAAV